MEVGFLHPGSMGVSLAANCSVTSLWASEGRSSATRKRAEQHGLVEVATVGELCDRADVVVSICPPEAAAATALQVARTSFDGVYVDANAISPGTAREVAVRFEHFVDASVIGPPADQSGSTRLYLSGDRADQIAALWTGSLLDARVLDGGVGAASALKMAYAGWSKISAALHLAVRALAAAEGVEPALVDEWTISQPDQVERSERLASAVSPKAWRFVGEVEQMGETFEANAIPAGFADAAAQIYSRLADFKGVDSPALNDVIRSILDAD